jgi:MHS family proline/betaine transporter-like MFS transporter
MIILTVAILALIYPSFQIMLSGTPQMFVLGQILLAIPLGMALGLQGAMVVEIFPLRTRVTSMSIAYSVTLALAGGTAPLISAWLIDLIKQPLAPAYYVMLHAVVGLIILWPMKETNTRPLDR